MKTIRLYILPLIILTCLLGAGCTHNNGDIGPLFGRWKLIEASGLPQSAPEGIFWAFQSSVIQMQRNGAYGEESTVYGKWQLDRQELRLDFPDEDYAPLPELDLPRQCSLRVEHLSRSEMKLTYTNPDGGRQTYTLKKW